MIGIGIDIGGTFVKMIAVKPNGSVLAETSVDSKPGQGPDALVKRIASVLNLWKKQFDGEKLTVGMGVAGDTDPEHGIIRFAPNLNRWRNIKISAALKKLTGISCVIENDANMATWGAYDYEMKRKYHTVLCITLGTGVGGGVVIGGRMFHGATGSAGEVGHMKIVPDGAMCNCGGEGCLEAYVGQYAIVRRAEIALKTAPNNSILKKICAEKGLTPLSIYEAAERRDKLALAIWEETGKYLGIGLANLALVLNPDAIVLTGGVSRANKFFMPALRKVLSGQQIKTPFSHLKLVISKKSGLGSIGAALFAIEQSKNNICTKVA